MSAAIFISSNIAILAGYYVLSAALIRLLSRFIAVNQATRYGMRGFFATCSITHLHMAYHATYNPEARFSEHFFDPFSLANHVAQAIFVWMFVFGMSKALQESRRAADEGGAV
jgi:cell division protein FtsX